MNATGMRALLPHKIRAAGIHLGLSAVVFAGTVALMMLVWYPPPYFWIDGGWQFVRLAAAVDLVLGPLLTFIVFRPGKPSLRLDLTAIAFVQVLALTWGCTLMYQQRPVFLVFAYDRFFSVTWPQLSGSALPRAQIEAMRAEHGVTIRNLTLPESASETLALIAHAKTRDVPIQALAEHYAPLSAQAVEHMARHAFEPSFFDTSPQQRAALDHWLSTQGGKTVADFVFVAFQARYGRRIAAVDRTQYTLAGFIDALPPAAAAPTP